MTWKSGVWLRLARETAPRPASRRADPGGRTLQRGLAYATQQFHEAWIAREIPAQGQRIYEETDQALDFRLVRLAMGVPTTKSSCPL